MSAPIVRPSSAAGLALVEVVVSLGLTLLLASALLLAVSASVGSGRRQPEATDLQQRSRAAADLLGRDLYLAGAGNDLGPAAGPLVHFMAPVLPRRLGLRFQDRYDAARADAITIAYAVPTVAQTILRDPLPSAASPFRVAYAPNCPPLDLLCGFAPGTSVLVFDRAGQFDFFAVEQAQTDTAWLRSWQAAHPSYPYAPGAVAVEAALHVYYLDQQNRELRHFDGYLTDTAVVDNVVGLSFEYFGDPQPPALPKPPLGTANCLYDAAGAALGGVGYLAGGGTVVPLPLSSFTDGPWCGDGENAYDADLLRIRRVRVTLRLQVGDPMMRGRTADNAIAGTAVSAGQIVPDSVLTFDVAPRNMRGGL